MANPHKVTQDFEQALSDYTGAPYVVAVDSCSNAILLSLWYQKEIGNPLKGKEIGIPKHTYMSAPCSIMLCGGKVSFYDVMEAPYLQGAYKFQGTNVYDSALRFTADMMNGGKDYLVCLSFSGAYKHLKLGKGGAILTDSKEAYEWLKKARYSGRNECSYHDDTFTQIGINAYMHPSIAALGVLLMQQFYNPDGSKKHNEDVTLKYPDLSKHPAYQ